MLKLPHLLATLPASGRSALVRPSTWPENSFYKVTRTQLKFRLAPAAGASAAEGSAKNGESSKSGARGNRAGDVEALKESLATDEIKAGGKAWGMLFWKGKFITRPSPIAASDELIRGGLKRQWLSIDPSSLDPTVRAALDGAEGVRREKDVARKEEVRRRREARKEKVAA